MLCINRLGSIYFNSAQSPLSFKMSLIRERVTDFQEGIHVQYVMELPNFPTNPLLGLSRVDILLQGGLQIGASSNRVPGDPGSVIMSPLSGIMNTDGLK